ncbi:hypothetical protein BKA57DRAFT_441348 [Linnemannia elongata]|nr:hypothetical protein BKA57DRAFT_441348 [Linnemannia elongata]
MRFVTLAFAVSLISALVVSGAPLSPSVSHDLIALEDGEMPYPGMPHRPKDPMSDVDGESLRKRYVDEGVFPPSRPPRPDPKTHVDGGSLEKRYVDDGTFPPSRPPRPDPKSHADGEGLEKRDESGPIVRPPWRPFPGKDPKGHVDGEGLGNTRIAEEGPSVATI